MNRSSTGTLAFLIVASLIFIARTGCGVSDNGVAVDDYNPPTGQEKNGAVANESEFQPTAGAYAPSTIIIGSFNIQVFGPTKASKPDVMASLVDVTKRFDLLAIQEVRNEDQSVIENFVAAINADGSRYSYIIGPRQGYTYSKEQYVYLFDTAKFRLISPPYVAADTLSEMHRPPLVASFECTQAPPGQGFSFTVLNVHVDPDVVDEEFAAMDKIVPRVRANHPNEDDFIVLGDFNDSEKGMRKYRWLNHQQALIRSNWATKIRSRRSIDNIVLNGMNTAEYRNQSGVMNLMQHFQLNEQQALEISDHFPVWSVFSTLESQNRFVRVDPKPRSRR